MSILKVFLKFTIKVLVLSLLLGGIHCIIATQVVINLPATVIFEMYAYILIITVLAYAAILVVGKRDFDKIGFAYAGLVLIKMMISFAFLYPFLKSPEYEVKEVVFNFFAIYLLFVFFEAREAYLLIQKGPFTPQ